MEGGVSHLLAAALHPARTRLTSTNYPSDTTGDTTRRSRSRCAPGHAGHDRAAAPASQTDTTAETGQLHNP
jgi:hypothetical protein